MLRLGLVVVVAAAIVAALLFARRPSEGVTPRSLEVERSGGDEEKAVPHAVADSADLRVARQPLTEEAADDVAREVLEPREDNGEEILGERAADYRLTVALVDRDGQPAGAVDVRVHRGEGAAMRVHSEDRRTTDDRGEATLTGVVVGPKTLVVDARRKGFRMKRLPMPVVQGASRVTLVLDRGFTVHGIALMANPRLLLEMGQEEWKVPLCLRTSTGELLRHRLITAGQNFQFMGVDPGPFTLSLDEDSRGWKSFEYEGVALPGSSPKIELRLERHAAPGRARRRRDELLPDSGAKR